LPNSGREAQGGTFDDDANRLTKYYGFGFDPAGTFAVDGLQIVDAAEPSSVALAALGLIGLAAWGWRRKRA
jgi:hypothetical protein